MFQIRRFIGWLPGLFVIAAAGCAGLLSPDQPPDIPLEELRNAPDTVQIENQSLILQTYLWRDFMPVSPPDGKPLIAIATVESLEPDTLPDGLQLHALYLVHDGEVWKAFLEEDPGSGGEPEADRLAGVARNGPKWGPHIHVQAVVRLGYKNRYLLLRAAQQYIHRTD